MYVQIKMDDGADNLGATIDDDLTDSGIGRPEVILLLILIKITQYFQFKLKLKSN